jgi:hypothetical protein
VTADELSTENDTAIGVWLELDLDAQPIEGTLGSGHAVLEGATLRRQVAQATE